MLERLIHLDGPLDLASTMAPMRHGPYDPTIRLGRLEVWRTTRTPGGPATVRLVRVREGVRAQAWGPGAREALERAPDMTGARDDPTAFRPDHPLLRRLAARLAAIRMPRAGNVFEALLPAVTEQKVTGLEAQRAYRRIVRTWGEPGPGPAPDGMLVAPSPEVLARLPYHAFHPLGLERRRAELVIRIARLAPRLAEAEQMSVADAERRLRAVVGIGPWTAAEVRRVALGDPDAVSVGDYHVPSLVCWALAGEPRGTDARMLELLEPYRGQRGRVQLLLERSGLAPPRYGPRLAPRAIEAF
jgi:3-methyladenine DNA glycosylase/8-oxoguanine DNA glycosylase